MTATPPLSTYHPENQRFVRWNLDGYCASMNAANRDRRLGFPKPVASMLPPDLPRQGRRAMERRMLKAAR